MTRSIPWPRILAEGVAIVVSILLAFGIQAWWQGVQDRLVEEAHLGALQADLTESLRLLAEYDRGLEGVHSALINLLESDLGSEPGEVVAQWMKTGLFEMWEYEPRMASLGDLQASNQLGLLTPEVRRQVSGVVRALTDNDRVQRDLRGAQEGFIDPFLVDNLPMASVIAETFDLSLSDALPASPDWSALGRSDARNRMAVKLSLITYVYPRRATLLRELQSLKTLVDARLGDLR